MKSAALMLTIMGSLIGQPGRAAELTPFLLETKIALGEVLGRIDHLAVDLKRKRLFVAELENDAVSVVDLDRHQVVHVIAGLKKPQGLGYLPSTDTLYVANGGEGSLDLFRGEDYQAVARIHLGDDADNVRVDAAANRVLVGYGNGALAVIDAASRSKVGDIALKAHPESFQLDENTNRVFVNDPINQAIVGVDRAAGKQTTSWPTGNGTNFPMALETDAKHVVVAFRNPARLGVFSMQDGALVAGVESCADADDMFVDAKRRRVYVSCGDGFLDVFDAREGAYRRIAHIATIPGARTSLFVPEMDRLFVAARATLKEPAAVWVFMPNFEGND
jgi:DNA-binding beta-propeller fold protein YncE